MAIQKVDTEQFLELAKRYPIIDVRSPGEYKHAHIPAAYSLPLFSDEERKIVGTAYKQESRERAIKIGLDFFGKKMVSMVEEVEKLTADKDQNHKTVLVHCWRGGMRSAGVAWLLDLYGFKVYTLVGGYKVFRNWVLDQFNKDYPFELIGGYTGSGKTIALNELHNCNEAVIDLENLANHKGSAFGNIGLPPQPSQEMFENELALELKRCIEILNQTPDNPKPVIWLEDESQRIGNINIPMPLWKFIRRKPVIFLDIPFEERLAFILSDYGKCDKEKLLNAIVRIQKRLGGLETKTAINFLLEDNLKECFRILLKYYDKLYQKGLQSREGWEKLVTGIPGSTVEPIKNAQSVLGTKNKSNMPEEIKLTQFSHGGGCGCKIAPGVLEEILNSQYSFPDNKNLLVGNHSKDDAAVYDLGNGTAVISTTDFFMPIVNDAFDFGRIASANAISDVYAMGGKPIMAIAVLGWPIDKLPASVAQRVLEGSRSICAEAGIPLAGGHSIDAPEPIFGLAVTGIVDKKNLKQNNTAKEGDQLYITKKIGVGIVSTAQKRELITELHFAALVKQLTQLNSLGEKLGSIRGVNAMTDITGFGLLGHLTEMAEGSGLTAEITYDAIPIIDGAKQYLAQKVVPGATKRNWLSISRKVSVAEALNEQEVINLLCDPQTNGGLLISVNDGATLEVEDLMQQAGYTDFLQPIGRMTFAGSHVITVK